ncbi:hypothetical protein P43SY_001092 [Pythium insidiosum]|uniref:Protein kinase domain-containing protein n=1 Tax=Pythium insidiosum TaxID=114742 RepID=A0AAD5L938_PYTIN|nr:hypothetical protein P43SY_001092 [Pythium insidiosum]
MPTRPPRTSRRISDVVRLLVVVAMLVMVAWNMSLLSAARLRSVALKSPPQAEIQHQLRQQLKQHEPPAHQQQQQQTVEPTAPPMDGRPWFLLPQTYEDKSGCDFSRAVRLFEPRELEINCDNIASLELGEYLGEGFWREVFKAQWNGREVAVKLVKPKLLERADIIPRHVEEAVAMFPIRQAPNIVGLVGWCNTTVIVEYVALKLDELVFDPSADLPVRVALQLARDAARGLAQLHGAPGGPFAHTDIQTRQFLVEPSGRLKLNDFNRVKYVGRSRLPGESHLRCLARTNLAKGKWRSPEEYRREDVDESTDIYSLALVMWTLRSRVPPFESLPREQVYARVPEGLRPPVEAMQDYPQAMRELIVRAWHGDPAQRPSAQAMADEIQQILEQYDSERRRQPAAPGGKE